MMADSSEQSEQTQLFIKMVDAINYVTSVSKKKPTNSRNQKYLFKNAIDIQDGFLEILLEQLEEEGVAVNYGDRNESAYKVVKDLNSLRNPIISEDKWKGTVNDTLDSSFSLSKSKGDTVTELEGFMEKNANKIVTHKEGRNDNPYEFLISAQEKQLKMQSEIIFYLRKEMDCLRGQLRIIDKLLQTLVVRLQLESLIRNSFLLQNSKIN